MITEYNKITLEEDYQAEKRNGMKEHHEFFLLPEKVTGMLLILVGQASFNAS